MDPSTIREARRILHDLVFKDQAFLSSGKHLQPQDDQLVSLVEKIAGRKLEEPEAPKTVDDFTPQGTYHEKPKDPSLTRPNPDIAA